MTEIVSYPYNQTFNYILGESVTPQQKRRRVLGFIGGGILVGYAIDVVEDYFEAKHGVPKAGVGGVLKEHSGGGGGHVEFFNGAPGHRLTGLEAHGLSLSGHPGSESIKHGANVIVPHVGWDAQGNLDSHTKELLRQHGFSLSQDSLGDRFMTDIS